MCRWVSPALSNPTHLRFLRPDAFSASGRNRFNRQVAIGVDADFCGDFQGPARDAFCVHVGVGQGAGSSQREIAAGTDGRDGPTDAAGAILDSQMPLDIASAKQAFLRHDVWNYLDQSGGLFRPGASGTNLADLVVIIAG